MSILVRRFIKDNENTSSTAVRQQYGKLSGVVGIIVNVALFVAKLTAGALTSSVSIVADAVNNLSDAGTSIISLVSFKLSSKPADNKHPFGHARIEYLASSLVAVFILFIGFELVRTSVDKIMNPTDIVFSVVALIVLAISIIVKFWLYVFNSGIAKRINSTVITATAVDSLSDVAATSAVFISTLLSPMIGFSLDGYMGIAVAIFIMVSGIGILKDTVDRILGQAPSEELITSIDSYILKYEGIIGTHDLMVHDYGPGRCFASVHAEVNANENILDSHDLIDNIERDIEQDCGIHLVIHMDPLVTDDPYVNELHSFVKDIVEKLNPSITMHDFRVVKGSTHSNLIFDVSVPFEYKPSDTQIRDEIAAGVSEHDSTLYTVITIDRTYIPSTSSKIK